MSQEKSSGVLSWNHVLSLYLPGMLLMLGSSMVAPVIPVYAKSFEVTLTTAAWVFVAYNTGAVAATFPAGYLMDKIGRRPVVLSGPIITAIAAFLTPHSGTFFELLFWRFLSGAAWQVWQQGRLAVIADTARHGERARQVQWMMGASRAGQLFGPAVGGFLAAGFGIAVPFFVYGALTLLAVIPSFKLIKETAPEMRKRKDNEEAVDDPGWKGVISYILTFQMLVFLTVQLLANMSRGGQEHGSLNLYAVYAYDVGPDTLGLLSTAAIIFGLPVPFISGYLMDKFGRRAVIVPGFSIFGVSLILMSTTAFASLPFEFFLLTYVLVQATQGMTGGTMQVLGTDLSPSTGRGKFFAIWRMISQVGATITPAIFAFIADSLGYGAGFIYLALCAGGVALGVGVVLGDTLARHDREDREKSSGATA
ncbi:MAG: MFS transporter [Chloroflexota bacterium]